MRYFFSTGEPSGEMMAVALAQAIRPLDPDAHFEGIGAARMREAGFTLWRDNTGWASFGPLAAVPRIPKLAIEGFASAAQIVAQSPDLVVLIDYGAFNLRLASLLRRRGFRKPILDVFPPGAWLDRESSARAVAALATPLTGFARQRDFFSSLGLPIAYFGHPLVSRYAMRPPRAAPAFDAGTVALLPGSRKSELRRLVPLLLSAFELLRRQRPQVRGVAAAADDGAAAWIQHCARCAGVPLAIERGVEAAVKHADAAWVASGTAVLECALLGTPAIAFYVVGPLLKRYVQRVYRGRFVTLPNLVAQEEIVPELLQDRATPQALADEMNALLLDPQAQYARLRDLRAALGPPDALQRAAAFAVTLAADGRR